MRYSRQIVQYNDLVIDEADMISVGSIPRSFKSFRQPFGFAHGSYSPKKGRSPYAQPMNISANIKLRLKKLPCDVRGFYKQFVNTQLSTYGKIWSVENNTLEWAYAELDGITEVPTTRKDVLEYVADFYLPEGIWHKADLLKTFLVPYDKCTFMDCLDYKEIKPCFNGDCCHCGKTEAQYCNCCECDELTKDMALCYQLETGCCAKGLQEFYSCDIEHRIVYDCAKAEKFFMSTYYGNEHLGEKFCSDCGDIAGVLYSNTEYPTTIKSIRLHGKVTNPYIEINGNGNYIKGEYENLTINGDGSVYSGTDCDPYCDLLSVGKWVVPEGNVLGWTIYPGNNRFIVRGSCCNMLCAYVEVDEIC